MKKLALLLVFITAIANAQIVNIPDANFKAKLISLGVDSNSDGDIQQSEAQTVYNLNVANSNISDLTGIQSFIYLMQLDCNDNQISNLNLTGISNLSNLFCNNNQITNLNIVGLTNLNQIYCKNNQISVLNLIGFNNLMFLDCENNQISNLVLPTLLNSLFCDNNQLITIDCSNNTNLHILHCSNNLLTTLDVSGLPLTNLYCDNNQLASIDLSHLNSLDVLSLNSNHLTTIDISSVHHYVSISMINNPIVSLFLKNGFDEYINSNSSVVTYVCEDESGISYAQMIFPTAVVNSFCSFVPGGNFYVIQGNIKFDGNVNGCDASDFSLPNIKCTITNGAIIGGAFSNNLGDYFIPLQSGNYTITPVIENPSFFTITPPQFTVIFPSQTSPFTQNICVVPNGIHQDIETVIAPIVPARPGFDSIYEIICKNKGNQTFSGNIDFTYNDGVLDFVSATTTPNSQSTGSLTWNYTNFLPFENRSFYVTFHVNAPTDTPPVNIGDILSFTTRANPILGDEIPVDNVFAFSQTVVGSYDPNNKVCLEGDVVSTAKIGDYLHYNINFENIGTVAAANIVVKDIIDIAKFDINTLQVMYSSHPMTTRITGDKLEFIFENINLAAAQHGNVTFKIKTKSSLTTGNVVTNKADIYFDYNFPVETNSASTTFQTLSTGEFELDNSVKFYPNPAKNNININCNSTIKSIELFDVQGRILTTKIVDDSQSSIDISAYSNGIYFVKATTEKGSKVEKVVKK